MTNHRLWQQQRRCKCNRSSQSPHGGADCDNKTGDANGQIIACGNTSGGANATDLGNANGGANDLHCRTEQTEGEPDERTTSDSGSSRAVTATAPQ